MHIKNAPKAQKYTDILLGICTDIAYSISYVAKTEDLLNISLHCKGLT